MKKDILKRLDRGFTVQRVVSSCFSISGACSGFPYILCLFLTDLLNSLIGCTLQALFVSLAQGGCWCSRFPVSWLFIFHRTIAIWCFTLLLLRSAITLAVLLLYRYGFYCPLACSREWTTDREMKVKLKKEQNLILGNKCIDGSFGCLKNKGQEKE